MKPKKQKPTKEQLKHIKKAIDYFGSQSALARAIKVSNSAVSSWRSGKNSISDNNAHKIQKATKHKVFAHRISHAAMRKKQLQELSKINKYR